MLDACAAGWGLGGGGGVQAESNREKLKAAFLKQQVQKLKQRGATSDAKGDAP
jgi:hypothetical protein